MSTDLSNLIERRAWDDLAGDPTNAKAMKRLAREKKRRGDLERLIGPDGKLVYRDPPATGALSIDEHGILRFGEASRSETSLADRVDAAAACADPGASDAQKKAGNYQCGHVTLQGLDITIETAKGQKRRPEWKALSNHYGYIKRTRSEADGDHVDVFLGDCPQSEIVFIVDQVNQRGTFDEHKVMIGFTCAAEAKAAYLSNYEAGWTGFGGMKALTMAQFKDWLDKGDTGSRAVPQRVNYEADDAVMLDRAWRLMQEDRALFMIDQNGKMHKDAGSPDGGQFTGKGGGGAKKEKPRHGERAAALHKEHASAKEQYEKAKAAYAAIHQKRLEAFNAVKADADAAHAGTEKHVDTIEEHGNHLLWDSDIDTPYTELETAIGNYSTDDTPGERFQNLKEIERTARVAMKFEQKETATPEAARQHAELTAQLNALYDESIAMHKEWEQIRSEPAGPAKNQKMLDNGKAFQANEAKRKALEKQRDELGHDGLPSREEIAANQERLRSIIQSAKQAREQLKLHVAHRKEMLAIKRGEAQ